MSIVHMDRMETLALVERYGVIMSMTRLARIQFTPAEVNAIANESKFSLLQVALSAVGLPGPRTTLAEEGFSNLILVERNPKIAENDKCYVDVELKYEHILAGPSQLLFNPPSGVLFGKGRCSVTEKATNFYYPEGDRNAPRTLILVAHSFAPEDTGVLMLTKNTAGDKLPKTLIQGGEVTIPFPQGNFSLAGYAKVVNPWLLARRFVACINKNNWLQEKPFKWLCSDCSWKALETDINTDELRLYEFTFEFQFNDDGWNPRVAFNDQRTGRPPADSEPAIVLTDIGGHQVYDSALNRYNEALVQPAGFWDVPALKPIDFTAEFTATFEGNLVPIVV